MHLEAASCATACNMSKKKKNYYFELETFEILQKKREVLMNFISLPNLISIKLLLFLNPNPNISFDKSINKCIY